MRIPANAVPIAAMLLLVACSAPVQYKTDDTTVTGRDWEAADHRARENAAHAAPNARKEWADAIAAAGAELENE